MSSFFKVEVQGQMEDLGPLTLTGKRSGETPRAQGALWEEAESFAPALGWDWGGLTESKGTCDLVWWLGEGSCRRHDKGLVGWGGVNAQASLPGWVLVARGIPGLGIEGTME